MIWTMTAAAVGVYAIIAAIYVLTQWVISKGYEQGYNDAMDRVDAINAGIIIPAGEYVSE